MHNLNLRVWSIHARNRVDHVPPGFICVLAESEAMARIVFACQMCDWSTLDIEEV